MGNAALFVEHPTDAGNRVSMKQMSGVRLPWMNPKQVPLSLAGHGLSSLFMRAFVDGLHEPAKRPSAAEWSVALGAACDLVVPCPNKSCVSGWQVLDGAFNHRCPFCNAAVDGPPPILSFYKEELDGKWSFAGERLAVREGQTLTARHVASSGCYPDQVLGKFELRHGQWHLLNTAFDGLTNVEAHASTPIGSAVKLRNCAMFLLRLGGSSRVAFIQ